MRIKNSTIETILEDCDIVKVAEKYGMSVKKSGVHYRAICPWHEDHTPSLTFYSESNQCHCFTCGAHANAIQLVQKLEGLDFLPAVESLGKQFGIEIGYNEVSDEQEQAFKKKESLLANMAIVEEFYHREFLKSEKAQEYAYGRWGKEFCDLMKIGYAPASQCSLSGLGINDKILQELGLVNANHDDIFNDRLTISIRDRFSRVRGFTCRNFDGSNPKYLNNADSDIFHKSEVLFGIDTANKEISRSKKAYLVEGAPDCYRLQSIGVTNSVACLGSAWNDNHFLQLEKIATNVCFIPDCDIIKPGQKFPHGIHVVMDAGRIAIEKGLSVYVKEIPSEAGEKQDADSYFTSKEVFDGIPEEDFVLWNARKLFDSAATVDDKTLALNTVANILSDLNDSTKVDFYIGQLKKFTDGKSKIWTDALRSRKEGKRDKKHQTVTMENTSNSQDFGFIIQDRRYLKEEKGDKITLSNFILTPMFHVLDSALSRRIFIIENIHGSKNIIELRSEELVSNDKFEAKVGEIGNYVWWGGKEDLKKIKGYLFANTDTALLIKQLGWQPQGFFAYGNGVFDGDIWHEANDYGIVKLEDKGNYYLPGHSMIYRNDRKMFHFEHNFIHREGSSVTLKKVTDQMFKVFGNNGRVAFLFLLASLYHDIVAYTPSPGWFPILDLFGPMGTGKTALAELISVFFTKKKTINIDNATIAAMSDEVAAAANAVVVFNEYKNSIDDSKIEFLKGAWDLVGRTRMSLNKDGQKEMTAVDSGIIITGQEMPTKDNALFSRTIFLTFANSQFTPEQSEEFKKLAMMREKGLTHLTMGLLKYRDKMSKEYIKAFYEVSIDLKTGMSNSPNVERIINNWAVPLAVYKVLQEDLDVSINYDDILKFIRESMKRQTVSCKTSDELASFFTTLQFLHSEGDLKKEGHFDIKYTRYVKSNDGKETSFDDIHPVLYLRKAGIIEIYQKACKGIGSNYIPKESLEFYMKNTGYYLGYKKWRFVEYGKDGYPVFDRTKPDGNGGFRVKEYSTWAYAFDYAKLQQMYDLDFERKLDEDNTESKIF